MTSRTLLFRFVACLVSGPVQATDEPMFVLQSSHNDGIGAIAFSHDGKMLLSGAAGEAILWHFASGRVIRRFTVEGGSIAAVAFGERQTILIGLTKGKNQGAATAPAIEVWDSARGKKLSQFGPNASYIHRVLFSNDGRFAITTTDNGDTVWDTLTARSIKVLHTSQHPEIEHLSFGPNGTNILTGGGDGNVALWQA